MFLTPLCLNFMSPGLNLVTSPFSPDPPSQGALGPLHSGQWGGVVGLQFGTLDGKAMGRRIPFSVCTGKVQYGTVEPVGIKDFQGM